MFSYQKHKIETIQDGSNLSLKYDSSFKILYHHCNFRYQLNAKKNKTENYPTRKKNTYSAQNLMVCLANASSNEDIRDEENPLSKSVFNGSVNTDKIRILNVVPPERIVQGFFSFFFNFFWLFLSVVIFI